MPQGLPPPGSSTLLLVARVLSSRSSVEVAAEDGSAEGSADPSAPGVTPGVVPGAALGLVPGTAEEPPPVDAEPEPEPPPPLPPDPGPGCAGAEGGAGAGAAGVVDGEPPDPNRNPTQSPELSIRLDAPELEYDHPPLPPRERWIDQYALAGGMFKHVSWS